MLKNMYFLQDTKYHMICNIMVKPLTYTWDLFIGLILHLVGFVLD